MREGRSRWAALPPFLAGAAAATAAEFSAGLLLFSEEGFLPALTLILTVETAALGLGLWTRPPALPGGEVEELRRGWLFSLVAFALASVFSAALVFPGNGSRTGIGQGLGLALLGSLPLFAVGSLLGAMGRWKGSEMAGVEVGAPSVLGGALGFLLTGTIFLPSTAPCIAFLICLVALSGGALLHGWILDDRPVVLLRESHPSSVGEQRVEDRVIGNPPRELRVLTEGGRLRGAEDGQGGPAREWEGAVLAALRGEATAPDRVLYLGGGSGTLARLLRETFPEVPVHLVERTRELVELARRSFKRWDGWDSVELRFGELLSVLRSLRATYPLVLVDVEALPFLGRLPFLEDKDWSALRDATGANGLLVLGGFRTVSGEAVEILEVLRARGLECYHRGDLYLGELPSAADNPAPGPGREREAFLLFCGAEAGGWSPVLPGFRYSPPREA